MEVTFGKLRLRLQWWQLMLLGLIAFGLMLFGNEPMQVAGIVLGSMGSAAWTRIAVTHLLVQADRLDEVEVRLLRFAYHASTALVAGIVYVFVDHGSLWGWFVLCVVALNVLLAVANIAEYIYAFLFAQHKLPKLHDWDVEDC